MVAGTMRLLADPLPPAPGTMCRARRPDGWTSADYVLVADGSSEALVDMGIERWVALRPVSDSPSAPILVGHFREPDELQPSANRTEVARLLLAYAEDVAPHMHPVDAVWVAEELNSALAEGAGPSDQELQDMCVVLGAVVLGLPDPADGTYMMLVDADGVGAVPWRVDWRQPIRDGISLFAEGSSCIGSRGKGRRRIGVSERGTPRGAACPSEMIDVLIAGMQAVEHDIWPIEGGVRDIARAGIARLRMLDRLSGCYFADAATRIRNALVLWRCGSAVAEAMGASVRMEECFLTGDPASDVGQVASDIDLQCLDGDSMRRLAAEVERRTGGKLRTTIDTGPDVHVNYESIARSRRELQHELLDLIPAVVEALPSEKTTYALGVYRRTNLAGSVAAHDGDAYASEVLTAWVDREYAKALVAGKDKAVFWAAVALTRWAYDTDTVTKALRFLHLPYLPPASGEVPR